MDTIRENSAFDSWEFVSKMYLQGRQMKRGFTLIELMLVAGVFVFVITGLLLGYIGCLRLNDFNRNLTIAFNIAQLQIEELRNTLFYNITDESLDNITLENLYGFDGSCYIDVERATSNSTDIDVINIRLVMCWREMIGRIIGEDINLNGKFELTEDTNNNSRLDSPCVIETAIAKQ